LVCREIIPSGLRFILYSPGLSSELEPGEYSMKRIRPRGECDFPERKRRGEMIFFVKKIVLS
jgi:hypothetical protein